MTPDDQPEILRYFQYQYLPKKLADVSEPFYRLANDLVRRLPNGAERSGAPRRLPQSKAAAVRAAL